MTQSQIGPIPIPPPGQKRCGYFTFQADPQLAKHQWPYFSFRGAQSGPKFLITAGFHAGEYAGIEAAIRLGRSLNPENISGTVVIAPLLNVPGFYERSIYVNPEDRKNMNRQFPGNPNGTWSERFAYHFLNQVAARCNYLVDLHGGDFVEDLMANASYQETGQPEIDQRMWQMAQACGVDWVVKGAPTGERATLLHLVTAERGVPAIILEAGRWGQAEEEAVRCHVEGVQNILRVLDILQDKAVSQFQPRVLPHYEWLYSKQEGMFRCRAKVGDRVEEGQVIGEIVDVLGDHVADLISPCHGVVLFLVTSPAVKQGSVLVGIGRLD